jgi:WD40 repeat protein
MAFAQIAADETVVRVTAASVDGTHVVTVGPDGEVAVWAVDSHQRTVVSAGDDETRLAAVDRVGTTVATVAGQRRLRTWHLSGRTSTDLPPPGSRINSIRFSPDATQIVAALEDGSVALWRGDTPTQPRVFRGHQQVATNASFSPDGRYVVSVGEDATARVWDTSGSTPMRVFTHPGRVYDAAFSADGTRLLTGSVGGARVWRLDGSDGPIDLPIRGAFVWSVAFDGDGTEALAVTHDGRLRLWHIDWRSLVAAVRETKRSCLTADQRFRLLGDTANDAEAAYRACAAGGR